MELVTAAAAVAEDNCVLNVFSRSKTNASLPITHDNRSVQRSTLEWEFIRLAEGVDSEPCCHCPE
jgi:hypothetical protein